MTKRVSLNARSLSSPSISTASHRVPWTGKRQTDSTRQETRKDQQGKQGTPIDPLLIDENSLKNVGETKPDNKAGRKLPKTGQRSRTALQKI